MSDGKFTKDPSWVEPWDVRHRSYYKRACSVNDYPESPHITVGSVVNVCWLGNRFRYFVSVHVDLGDGVKQQVAACIGIPSEAEIISCRALVSWIDSHDPTSVWWTSPWNHTEVPVNRRDEVLSALQAVATRLFDEAAAMLDDVNLAKLVPGQHKSENDLQILAFRDGCLSRLDGMDDGWYGPGLFPDEPWELGRKWIEHELSELRKRVEESCFEHQQQVRALDLAKKLQEDD